MKKNKFLLLGLIALVVIIALLYFLLIKHKESKEWILYDECNNIGGEIVLLDTSSVPYTIICPSNKNYIAKIKNSAIEAICCK